MGWTSVWLFLAFSLLALPGLIVELTNLRDFPALRPRTGGDDVDVYVAMRDEARACAAFLDAVLAMPEVRRIVVADDRSTDGTAAIVREYAERSQRVCLHDSAGAGKSAALAGAVAAFPPSSRWLLFLDADVALRPGAASALTEHARATAVDAVSVWLRVRTPTIWSMLLAPCVTLFLLQALPMRAARGTDPRFAAANGQCFLIAADAYARCGGHASIAHPVEDVALARALKRSGSRVALASGACLGTVEGYRGLRDNLRGYGRSLYCGAGATGCAIFALWQAALVCAPAVLFVSRAVTAQRMREPVLGVVLAPAAAALACAMALDAALRGRRGAIEWRGRKLSSGETAARP